jgi:hypothetical protein
MDYSICNQRKRALANVHAMRQLRPSLGIPFQNLFGGEFRRTRIRAKSAYMGASPTGFEPIVGLGPTGFALAFYVPALFSGHTAVNVVLLCLAD